MRLHLQIRWARCESAAARNEKSHRGFPGWLLSNGCSRPYGKGALLPRSWAWMSWLSVEPTAKPKSPKANGVHESHDHARSALVVHWVVRAFGFVNIAVSRLPMKSMRIDRRLSRRDLDARAREKFQFVGPALNSVLASGTTCVVIRRPLS